MYESKSDAPIPHARFIQRLLLHIGAAFVLLLLSLALGMWGYQHYEHLLWRDAFLNASMLLGGMGPVDAPHSDSGKLFAGLYALYAGLFFLIAASLVLTPVLHRVMHQFHWDEDT